MCLVKSVESGKDCRGAVVQNDKRVQNVQLHCNMCKQVQAVCKQYDFVLGVSLYGSVCSVLLQTSRSTLSDVFFM